MQDVAGHGKEISLRIADAFVMFNPHQTQKDLLGQIRRIHTAAHAQGKELPQPLAIAVGHVGEEGLSALLIFQFGSGGHSPRSSRALEACEWLRSDRNFQVQM